MISNSLKPLSYQYSQNRPKNNLPPYDNIIKDHHYKNINSNQKQKNSKNKHNLFKQQNQQPKSSLSRNKSKIVQEKMHIKLPYNQYTNQNNPNLINVFHQENLKNSNQSQYAQEQEQSSSIYDYIQKIKSTILTGQKPQYTCDPYQDQDNVNNFHSPQIQEQLFDHYDKKNSKINDFFKKKIVQPKQKYWPVMEQIQQVAGDMITTSQRKPGQSSKKQFKDLKQKNIKSHRDHIKNSARLKSNNLQPVNDLIIQDLYQRKSIQLDNKSNIKLNQSNPKNTHTNNKSYSNINKNYIYTHGNNQTKKQEKDKFKYKKPQSLPKSSRNSKSQFNLNKKVKHLSIQSDARKRKQSTNSVQSIAKPNNKKKILSLSAKSKQFDKQKDQQLRDSNSKGKSSSKNSVKTHRVSNQQKIKLNVYQQLQNKTQKNQKNIKMLWNCIGQLWQQTRINQYVSQKNQTKIKNFDNKINDQQEIMMQIKIKTDQLIASQLKKNSRV